MWHSFRERKYPIVNPIIYYYTGYNKSNIGTDFEDFRIIENGWSHDFILEKNINEAAEFLLTKLLENNKFIKERVISSRKFGNKFLNFCKQNLRKDLERKNNKQLVAILKEYFSFYEKFSVINITPWLFLADRLSAFLIDKLKGIADNPKDIFILLSTPNFQTYTKEENMQVVSSVLRIKNGKSVVEKEAKKLASKYFWITFDYFGPDIWDEEHYGKRIKELMKLTSDDLEAEVKKGKLYQKELRAKQLDKIKELDLPKDIVSLFESMRDMAVLQDEKKAITTESHYYLQSLYKEMGKRINMDFMDFYMFLINEIEELLSGEEKRGVALQRRIFSTSLMQWGSIVIAEGEEAKKLAMDKNPKFFEEDKMEGAQVKGISASMGKASGTARVLLSSVGISEMIEGEVLVATMTTPDYVPAMRKASAIVTDEGGITCHAAIVSRELGIPCIIGTKNATKVLKSGDLVEVDADKGIIKIIR